MGMEFDPIMNVGRIPQVTSDVIINPLALPTDDITAATFGIVTTAGTNVTQTGNFTNLLNPFYDYTATDPLSFSYTDASPNTTNTTLLFDIGKSLSIRSTTILTNSTTGAGTFGVITVTIGFSSDNSTWTDEPTFTVLHVAGKQYKEFAFTQRKFRYMRIKLAWTAGASTPITWAIDRLQFLLDSAQYLSS